MTQQIQLGYACINMELSTQKPRITTNRGMIKRTFLKKGIKYAFNVESKNYFKNSDNFAIPRFDCNEFKHGELFSK